MCNKGGAMPLRRLRLLSGQFIPEIGYGTYLAKDDDCYEGVLHALKVGYRHIDTAAFYDNEEEVGQAIKDSGIDRSELFITTKVWNNSRGYEKTIKSVENSLKKLDLEYLDLVLIHWPANEKQFPGKSDEINLDTRNALIYLYKEGKVKSIGVSNFLKHHVQNLIKNSEMIPMVDQLEISAGHFDEDLINFLSRKGIIVEGWSPLGRGDLLNNEEVLKLAKKYNKTSAQILIRFLIDCDVVPLVKSINKNRIEENLDYNDFELSEEDVQLLKDLKINKTYKNPDEIDF